MDDLMLIGEFSARSGLSAKRLRSYASAGLLVPAAVDSESGYRYYAPAQLRDAHLIDALRDAGMPLSEIATLLRDPSSRLLDVWARQVDVEAAQRQEALRRARRLIAHDAASIGAPTNHDLPRRHTVTVLATAARTDIGRVRDSNQDAVLNLDRLVAVADGMGRTTGGQLASSLALTLLEAAFTGRSLDELEAAVRAANRAIFDRASTSEVLEGMGTTICAVGVTDDGGLAVVNVGDSRAYLLRDGSLQQLTDDHTVAADLVRRGELTHHESLDHPHRSVLTRALGAGPTVEVNAAILPARAGDRLVVCTDGLTNEVAEQDISRAMTDADDLQDAVDLLVDQAITNGGRDNVAIVMAQIQP